MDPGRLHLDIEELADRLWQETTAVRDLAHEAAVAEAAYRSAHARAYLEATGPVAEREAIAAVAVEKQYRERRIAEARLRAAEEVVRTLRSTIDVARTLRADMRTAT